MDSSTETQLNDILADLNRIYGVESCLISDSNGNVLGHSMSGDTSLFGPMAHVITSSASMLLDSANQGQIERVLVESKEGKALFLHPGDVHFIILMETHANVGFVMLSAKRAALKIREITKDIIFKGPDEETLIPAVFRQKSEIDKIIESEKLDPGEIKEVVEEIAETEGVAKAFDKIVGPDILDELMESPQFGSLDPDEAREKLTEILETKIEAGMDIEEDNSSVEVEELKSEIRSEKEVKSSIPIIKPPIPFPALPDMVQISENPQEKVNLILDIYESIFLAMSIGASKIMGVSPARGLIKRFLPFEDHQTLLKGVEVKNNSSLDFDKIRENTGDIPVDGREKILISGFSDIINTITENYGKIMGYEAFRGMVRAEFKLINGSYGRVMDELGILEKMHPELVELFK